MLAIPLLKKLGLYIDEHFLDDDLCIELCQEMARSNKSAGRVLSEATKLESLDTTLRKTQTCELSTHSFELISQKLLDIKPSLESFFDEQYAMLWERPKFLEYRKGDFFLPHTDDQAFRRINVSIYLNNQTQEPSPESYTGGELTIYDLIKSEGWQNRGITITGSQGLLIAYPANIVHEVTAINSGCRYAIVSRFLDKKIDQQ